MKLGDSLCPATDKLPTRASVWLCSASTTLTISTPSPPHTHTPYMQHVSLTSTHEPPCLPPPSTAHPHPPPAVTTHSCVLPALFCIHHLEQHLVEDPPPLRSHSPPRRKPALPTTSPCGPPPPTHTHTTHLQPTRASFLLCSASTTLSSTPSKATRQHLLAADSRLLDTSSCIGRQAVRTKCSQL
jgi:hypothetical protein